MTRADATLRTAVALRDATRAQAEARDAVREATKHIHAVDLPAHMEAATVLLAVLRRMDRLLNDLEPLRKDILAVVDSRATASPAEQLDALSKAAMVPAPNGEAA